MAPATARVFTGTKKANRVLGTGGPDVIRLGAGNDRGHGGGGADRILGGAGRDRLTGGAGADRVSGGAGPDTIVGGSGRDRLVGGAGNDHINAADGRVDVAIDGGSGRNTCRVDAAEVARTRHCASLRVEPAKGRSGGGGATPAPPANGSASGLSLLSADGLSCPGGAPVCPFDLTGGLDGPPGLPGLPGAPGLPGHPGLPGLPGADLLAQIEELATSVTGGGGVSVPDTGTLFEITHDGWSATGIFSCTSDGFLRVTIGTESLDVPVDCTA